MSLDDRDYMREKYEKSTFCNKRWSVGFEKDNIYDSNHNGFSLDFKTGNTGYRNSNDMSKNKHENKKYLVIVFFVFIILMIVSILFLCLYFSNSGVNIY